MKVLVVGATGATGQEVVACLRTQGIDLRAMVRDWDKGQALLPASTDIVLGNVMQPDSLKAAIAGCTHVICATGARPSLDPAGPFKVDYLGTRSLVKASQAAGIEHFVLVSSLCVSRFFHPLNLFWLVLYWKQRAEAYLQDSGLVYTIVRPGGLKKEDSGDAIIMAGADSLFEGSIPRPKVARVCVEALLEPAARHKVVEIISKAGAPVLSYQQMFTGV